MKGWILTDDEWDLPFFLRQSDSLFFPPQQRSIRICDLVRNGWGGGRVAQLFFYETLFSFHAQWAIHCQFHNIKHTLWRKSQIWLEEKHEQREKMWDRYLYFHAWQDDWSGDQLCQSCQSIIHGWALRQLGLTSAHTGTWCGIQFAAAACGRWLERVTARASLLDHSLSLNQNPLMPFI